MPKEIGRTPEFVFSAHRFGLGPVEWAVRRQASGGFHEDLLSEKRELFSRCSGTALYRICKTADITPEYWVKPGGNLRPLDTTVF